jgi:hypothetical protein
MVKSFVGVLVLMLTACSGHHSTPPTEDDTQEVSAAQRDDDGEGDYVEARMRTRARHVPKRIERFDSNHDGVLEASEVPPRLRGWFNNVDTNHDNIVTAQEIRAWNRQHHRTSPQPHQRPQAQHAGEITL